MPVPQKLPQIPVLPAGYPNLRKPILPQQLENMLTILAVRLMLAHSLGSDLGRIHKPQLDVQFCQQSLEPACVSTGLHPQTNGFSLAGKLAVELLRQLAMLQPLLFHFSRFCIDIRNLLEARMVIASYNNHVGSFLRALVGLHHQSLSGAGSRHCHGINCTHRRSAGGEANRLLSRVLLTLQNSQDRNYCVPVPCRRWHAVQLVDLAKIADCLHVAAVYSKHELALRSHHPFSLVATVEGSNPLSLTT